MFAGICRKWTPYFPCNDSIVQGSAQKQRARKLSIHFAADQDTVDNTIYRIILSVNQLSVYGAVAAICDEYESHQDSTGQPVILVGQSKLFLEKSKQKFLLMMKNPETTKLFGSSTFNKLNRFHQKIN